MVPVKVGPQNQAEVIDLATEIIVEILGSAEHPDVERVLDAVRRALDAQRRLIVRDIRAETRLGIYDAPPNQAIDYVGGLRRAAKIARGGGR